MCRFIDEGEPELQVCGVLTDYDLSSWTEDLKKYHAKMSKELIGTPPYMACELLDGTGSVHLYRHDVESLFYIMLMICGRRTIGPQGVLTREGNLPYQRWLDEWDHETLGYIKSSFITCEKYIELSSNFEDFRPWLEDLQYQFSQGFMFRNIHQSGDRRKYPQGSGELGSFDDETLGGYVHYSSLIGPVRYLTGELQGLVIRYDPSKPPLPTPAGATDVNA